MRKILSIAGVIWKILVPIISAILGLIIANRIDIFSQFSLPEGISSFEICIAVYFPVIDIIISSITEAVHKLVFAQSIEVVMWLPGNSPALKAEPSIVLNSSPTEMKLTISVKGNRCCCKSAKVTIEPPNFVTFGLPRRNPIISTDADGKVVLEVDKLFGGQNKVDTRQEFRILMTKEEVEGSSSSVISPIIDSNILVKTASNKVTVRTEG